MFSPDRFGPRSKSFSSSTVDPASGRQFVNLKTAFRKSSSGACTPGGIHTKDKRTPLQKAAHFRFSEPATPSVLKDRGLRPSDLSDPHKKEFLTQLTSKVFHLSLESGDEEQREKIPLERLFTPATDVDEILPQNKKKAFASSCFYRPDHPTIDDQVELAHKISVSLVDENNKASKGQNMYMKRKNRSSKWIHQGEEGEIISAASQFDQEEPEEERKPNLEKPNLKLVLSPKVTQDFNAVQRHYEELVSSTTATTQHITRMEVGKEIATNLESPTGKGAALFAKRKKRMDKFIVDETTVQQQQQQSLQEESSMTQMSSVASQMTQESSSLTADQTMHMNNGPAFIEPVPIVPPGNLKLPDLSQILTQPKPPEKKTSSSLKSTTSTISRSKSESVRSRSTDSKSSSSGKPAGFGAAISPASQKPKGQILGKQGEKSSNKVVPPHSQNDSSLLNSTEKVQRPIEDSLNDLRPGSPPVFLVPDGNGSFREAEVKTEPTEATIETKETPANNEGGAIYTAEVKVVQKPSLPSPMSLPDFSALDSSLDLSSSCLLVDQLTTTKEEEKRKSFNLAPKGWGTYSNFYTPVHLGV